MSVERSNIARNMMIGFGGIGVAALAADIIFFHNNPFFPSLTPGLTNPNYILPVIGFGGLDTAGVIFLMSRGKRTNNPTNKTV